MASATARSITCSSSLTLPGQTARCKARIASGAMAVTGTTFCPPYRARNNSASSGMSSGRSRSGGIVVVTVFRR